MQLSGTPYLAPRAALPRRCRATRRTRQHAPAPQSDAGRQAWPAQGRRRRGQRNRRWARRRADG
eukprot:5702920-Prymnesium_polylepis.1